MKKSSSIAITAIIMAILLSAPFNLGLAPVGHSAVTSTEWRLTVTGLVNNPLNLTLSDLVAMPQTTIFAQIYCVGPPGFFVEEGNWTGVRLALLLDNAGVAENAVKVAFFASDGFSTDLTVASARYNDTIVAYEKDGKPISETLRLVVPGRWGYKWIHHLSRIEIVDYDFLGKYESQGYSDTAEMIQSGAPTGVANIGLGDVKLKRNGTSSSPNPSPTPSPIQEPSPTPSPQPEEVVTGTPTNLGLTEEITYVAVAVAAVSAVSVSLIFYFVKFRKKNAEKVVA
jgi:hypothetical protein